MGHHSLILLGLVRGRERFVSALSQVKCQTAGVPEHVAEVEWFVTRRATKSHRAVNEFSNVATVQRLSPVGYIRPKRSAPRSSSLSPHVHFYALGLGRTYGRSGT